MEHFSNDYLDSIKHIHGKRGIILLHLHDGRQLKLFGDITVTSTNIKVVNSYATHKIEGDDSTGYDYRAQIFMPMPRELNVSFTDAKSEENQIFSIKGFNIVG